MILTVNLNPAIDKFYTVDSLSPGEINRSKNSYFTSGGKGLNVSKAINIAGEKVTATGFIGGSTGDFIRKSVIRAGIQDAFIDVMFETRTNTNIFDESKGVYTEILEKGEAVDLESLNRFLTNYNRLICEADIIAISGSAPEGAGDDIYFKLIEQAKVTGGKVILDASGELLKNGIKALPYAIKPNVKELKAIVNEAIATREDVIKAACKLQSKGIEVVIVSMGKDGAIVVSQEGVYQGIPPVVKVVNTVGCGDTMVAAFAVGISRGLGTEETLRLALAMSAANAETKEPGVFAWEHIDRYKELAKVTKVENSPFT